MAAEPGSSPGDPLGEFRSRVLERTLGIIVVTTAIAGVFQLVMDAKTGELVELGVPLVVVWAIFCILYRARSVRRRRRAGAVVVFGALLAAFDFLRHGHSGSGRLLFLGVAFVAALTLDGGWAATVLAVAAVTFLLPAVGIVPSPPTHLDFSSPAVWMAATAVTLLLPLVIVGPIGVLLRDLEQSLDAGQRLVESEREAQAKAEAALAAAEENRAWIAAIVEHSTAVIYVKDLEGRFVLANQELERRLGRKDVVGKTDHDLMPADFADRYRVHDREVIRTGVPARWREVGPAGGQVRTYVSAKFPVRDASGAIYGLAGISTDVTELARAEEARQEHEALFAAAFDASPDAVGLSGVDDGRFVHLNPGFSAMMGRTQEECLGKTSVELEFWTDPAERGPLMQKLMTDGEVRDYRIQLRSKAGEPRTGRFSAKIIENRGVPQVLAVVRDVSEQERAEAELAKLDAELEARVAERTQSLEAINRDLEAFSYTVSHDLRAPLRHMAGYIDLVRAALPEEVDDETRRLTQVVSRSAEKMGVLIDDLLRFARLGRVEMAVTDVDLGALVREVVAEASAQHGGRSIAWSIAELPVVGADRALLRQVLVNLVDNAVKYTRNRAEARITIGCRAIEGELEVFVEDNGEGFDPRYADQLFGVFQRLHPDFEGTGVGLAHVKRIIDRHGGTVRAAATPGSGATFSFVLPRAAAA